MIDTPAMIAAIAQGGSQDRVTIHPHVNKWLSDLDEDILGAVQGAAVKSI